jgi:hypothetical protein
MLTDTISSKGFKYGIKTTDDETRRIDQCLRQLKERAPSKCSIDLKFQKRRDSIKGTLTINSPAVNIHCQQIGHATLHTLTLLLEEVYRELLVWKANRFKTDQFEKIESKMAFA